MQGGKLYSIMEICRLFDQIFKKHLDGVNYPDPHINSTYACIGKLMFMIRLSQMDAQKENLTAPLPQKVGLDQLELGKNNQPVVIRVLRMWEAKNFKLNRTLMSLDLLLLDEKDTLIQASIHHRRIPRFKDMLKEGSIYLISSFEIVPTYSHYKVTNNLLTMRFTYTTQIIEVRKVIEVQGSNLEDSKSNQKIVLFLLLQQLTSNSTIRMTLWDDQASDFRQQFHQTGGDCIVIVCTCLNPKMFAGKLYLNSSGSTKIYFNYNLEVVKEFMKSNCNKSTTICVVRFRVELIVQCCDRTPTFVLFNRDARNITYTTAEDITTSEEKPDENTSNCSLIPKCLLELIEKTMDFQIKISKYNFEASIQFFTVTRIPKQTSMDDSYANSITRKTITTTQQTEDGNEGKIKSEDGRLLPTFATTSKIAECEDEENGEYRCLSEENDEKKKKNVSNEWNQEF